MEENNNLPENPYNNELALNELVKMMKRKELITLSFCLDRYGYESYEVESRTIDKFIIQHSDGLYEFIYNYLKCGELSQPIPSPIAGLTKRPNQTTNDLSSEILRILVAKLEHRSFMHIVPEIVDKPDRLTVTFTYPYGAIVFKVKRTKEMTEFLETYGF